MTTEEKDRDQCCLICAEEYTDENNNAVIRIDYDSSRNIKKIIKYYENDDKNPITEFYDVQLKIKREKVPDGRLADKDSEGNIMYYIK